MLSADTFLHFHATGIRRPKCHRKTETCERDARGFVAVGPRRSLLASCAAPWRAARPARKRTSPRRLRHRRRTRCRSRLRLFEITPRRRTPRRRCEIASRGTWGWSSTSTPAAAWWACGWRRPRGTGSTRRRPAPRGGSSSTRRDEEASRFRRRFNSRTSSTCPKRRRRRPSAPPAAPVPPPAAAVQTGPNQSTLVLGSKPISAASSFTVQAREFALRPIGSVQDILRVTPGLVVDAALGRGKGEPVLPARLRRRPRHRPGALDRRRSDQHGLARPRPGVLGHELHHPGGGGADRDHQGAVLSEPG